jgi:NDP-sugar pyrophosphorylase family protein
MISVGDRPFLDYLLSNAQAAGIRNVVLLVGERDNSIREYYQSQANDREFPLLKIAYAVQPIPAGRAKPFGTADALMHALYAVPAWRGRSFIVCNSDNLYSVRAMELLTTDQHPNALIDYDRSALKFDQSRISAFAVLKKSAEGFLEDIIEKPSAHEIQSATGLSGRVGVSMNIFKFQYDDILPKLEAAPLHAVRQEKELPEAVRMLVREKPSSVFTIPLAEHVPDLTSPDDILRVRQELQESIRR